MLEMEYELFVLDKWNVRHLIRQNEHKEQNKWMQQNKFNEGKTTTTQSPQNIFPSYLSCPPWRPDLGAPERTNPETRAHPVSQHYSPPPLHPHRCLCPDCRSCLFSPPWFAAAARVGGGRSAAAAAVGVVVAGTVDVARTAVAAAQGPAAVAAGYCCCLRRTLEGSSLAWCLDEIWKNRKREW